MKKLIGLILLVSGSTSFADGLACRAKTENLMVAVLNTHTQSIFKKAEVLLIAHSQLGFEHSSTLRLTSDEQKLTTLPFQFIAYHQKSDHSLQKISLQLAPLTQRESPEGDVMDGQLVQSDGQGNVNSIAVECLHYFKED